ncbi:MAG TPA: energy transducer TonB [Myxococcales bacterium]|nr:energy transducer TonB [Myxococcales bacterium]
MSPYPRYRDRHRSQDRRRLLAACALALPVAVLLVGLGALVALLPEEPMELERPPAQVALLDVPSTQWEQNRRVGAAQAQAARPENGPVAQKQEQKPEPKKEPHERIPGQIVDVAPTPDQNPPADTHRYSEYNTHVDHETQARDKTAFYKNAMPKHTTTQKPQKLPGKDMADKVQAIGSPSVGKEQKPKVAQKLGHRMEIPSVQKATKLALEPGKGGQIRDREGSEEIKGNSDRLRLEAGQGQQQAAEAAGTGGTGSHLTLVPSQSVLDRITGAPANDHLEGVDEGEGTYLNTREWKYASFFNRVKQNVAEHWDPGSVMRRRDPSGEIYGWRDRRTILSVTLNKTGGIEELTVEKSCGVDFLDEEAMSAFKRAQPFLNPPPALVDDSGMIRFSFGFYLEMNSGGLMQLFRGPGPN